jgi:N-methylhydantoinase A
VISVERGRDPRDYTLVSFGGAGGLHACALARALRIPRVLVPGFPGALSALGILISDVVKDYSRTVMLAAGSPLLEAHFRELEQSGQRELQREGLRGVVQRSLDMRYAGQGYELNVPAAADVLKRFHTAHRQRYGYADPARAVEVVNVRVRLAATTGPATFPKQKPRRGDARQAILRRARVVFDGRPHQSPIYQRDLLRPGDVFAGPAILVEYSATTVLPPGCQAKVDAYGNLVIEV